MQEFIDETATKQGTPINRKNMMSIQGFVNQTTTFNLDNGKIIQINSDGQQLTTIFNDDGTITETFVGEKTITKTTTFNSDGSIKEVLL